jgi:hypothetical protein
MVAAVTLAWGLAYRALAAQGAVGLGYHAAGTVASPSAPIFTRLIWVFAQSARSAFSLPPERGPLDRWTAIVLGLLLAIACVLLARSRGGVAGGARVRLQNALPLVLWGAAWWVASSVPLVDVYPLWSGQRGLYGSVGLGVALTGLLASAHPLLLVALVALRLCTFALSPVGPAAITAEPPAGAEGQFPHVARLQRMARETRTVLRDRFPSLPRGSIVGQHNMPALSRHAFAGDAALQVWYRDSTLHWLSFDDFHRHQETPLAAFVEYQPHGARPIALVEVEAMRGLLASEPLMGAARWAEAIATLERADSLQRDPAATVFLAQTAGHRAECQMMLGQVVAAEGAARRALGLWPEIPYARSTLAQLWMAQGRYAEAKTVLEMQLRLYPDDQDARALLDQLARAGAVR